MTAGFPKGCNIKMIISDTRLRRALENNEFVLCYQPKLDLVSGKIKGVEALIRWEHPEKGLIPPLEFISLAEESGLIIPIGEWAIGKACEQVKEWTAAGLPPMIMAVNLSGNQLYQSNLVQKIQLILEETGLSPKYLELEITESMMIDIDQVLPVVRNLKKIGVRISLDDFGTGYSSLYHLKEFPIDTIKIDQCFVRNCTCDEKDATIVKAIIAMAHQLKIEVLAEGIESREHLIFLQQNLCDKGQGYFFSKPISPEEFTRNFNHIEKILLINGIPQEVTREKWLEQELENARQELRDTIRQQQGMIFKFTERNGKFIHTLCDGELLYRLGLTTEHIVGKELQDFLPFSDVETKLKYYRRAWEGEEKVTYEREDNGIWYLASLRPIYRGGQVVEVIGSCIDITGRKESEQRYQKFVEYSPKGIFIHQDGNILYANPSALGLLKEDNLVGKSIYTYIHPGYHNISKQRLAQAKVGKELPIIEIELTRKNRDIITAEFGSVVIPYNGESATLTLFDDVTNRKRAEEALRHSEEKYRLITENMQDLIRVLDTDGSVEFASPSHERILGLKPHFYEGKSFFDWVHPKDIHHVKEQFFKMVESKKGYRVEYRCKHAQENWKYMESIGAPLFDERGEVEHVVVVARDISERKKVEEAIRKSDKLSVVGQLAAGVAHEIRNPLTSIMGFTQLLKKETENPFYFDLILSEISRLEDIVSGFLTLAKPQEPKMKEMNLKTLLEQVLTLFRAQANMSSIEIVVEDGLILPPLYCEANQIKQVLINILQNAVDAMPNGGKIKISTLTLQNGSDFIMFRIIDEGYGISEERMKHIGEPFYRTKEKGTGLGLMISQKIVQEHGGSINITSQVNQGTTVDVSLPIKGLHVVDN
jgi:PAS domain S-box-containing protein